MDVQTEQDKWLSCLYLQMYGSVVVESGAMCVCE